MATGIFNPGDSDRSTSTRPTFDSNGEGERRWYSDDQRTRPSAKELNELLAVIRKAGDTAGVTDTEGDDDYLTKILQTYSREQLAADRTYYVRKNGNDANTGLANNAGGAFLTIQHAVNVAMGIDANFKSISILVDDGVYSEAIKIIGSSPRLTQLSITGNVASPTAVEISNAADDALAIAKCGVDVKLNALKIMSNYATGTGLSVKDGSRCYITGPCSIGGSVAVLADNHSMIFMDETATITFLDHPSAMRAIAASFQSWIRPKNIDLSNTTYDFAIYANDNSVIRLGGTVTYDNFIGSPYYADASSVMGNSFRLIAAGTVRPTDGKNKIMSPLTNLLLNPDGALQFGADFAAAAAIPNDTYGIHNRWFSLTQSGTITPSTLVDPTPTIPNVIRLTNSAGVDQKWGYSQIIEARQVKAMRGSLISLSGIFRASVAGLDPRFFVLAWNGTADQPISDTVLAWNGGTYVVGSKYIATNTELVISRSCENPLANTFYNFDAQAFVPDDATNLVVGMRTHVAAPNGTTTDFRMQLEMSDVPSQFEVRDRAIEEMLCKRFVQRQQGTLPANADISQYYFCNPQMRVDPTYIGHGSGYGLAESSGASTTKDSVLLVTPATSGAPQAWSMFLTAEL